MNNVELKSVELSNGETLVYRVRSGGEDPLLLVHGNMSSSVFFDVLFEALDPRFQVVAVDLRGFGLSSYRTPIHRIEDFAEDLLLFADDVGLSEFSILGWSTGGGAALQLASMIPDRVRSVILMASMSTRGYPFYGPESGEAGTQPQRLTTWEEIAAQEKTQVMSGAIERGDKAFLRAVFDAAVFTNAKPSDDRYEAYLDEMLLQRNLVDVYHALNVFNMTDEPHECSPGTGALSRVSCPVLCVQGTDDLVITRLMTEELVHDLGDRLKLVEGHRFGHAPQIDDAEWLAREIAQFVLK
ncbi:intracellular short-chain-length polyhydroxyalkanoate depolymerase [Paenibacillus sedimenti]|uniref:Alpha/beta hydrolase n=1 Tax=Paenibacillus sedimenti TaxID=2770274 RepID=A0A926QGZ8_9BACL|nr:alpha/beta hydrolase [Paenibacillus sedimenti]MBD0378986.1 alpha/beta hydrolase [Paenibacillus sedimenti]